MSLEVKAHLYFYLFSIFEKGFSSARNKATPPIMAMPALIRVEPWERIAAEKAPAKLEPAIQNCTVFQAISPTILTSIPQVAPIIADAVFAENFVFKKEKIMQRIPINIKSGAKTQVEPIRESPFTAFIIISPAAISKETIPEIKSPVAGNFFRFLKKLYTRPTVIPIKNFKTKVFGEESM